MGVKKYDDTDVQRYIGVMTDNIVNRFRTGFEAIEQIKVQVDKIPGIEEDIAVIKADMLIMKKILKITNKDIRNHEKRITKLETSVFHA